MSGITSRHHFRSAQAMRSFRHNRSGNVLAVFGLSLPVVLAAAGAALDYSDLTRKRSELQKVADETALAAAKALATNAASSSSQRENEARELADRLLKEAAADAKRTIAPSAAESRVRIDLVHEHPFRFGVFIGAQSSSLAIQSEATYSAPASACIIALGQTEDAGISLVGSAKMTAPQCGIWSDAPGPNSITTQGAARIVGRTVCGVGSTRAASSPPAKSGCATVTDPYEGRPLRCGKNQTTPCPSYSTSGNGGSGHSGSGGGSSGSGSSTYTGKCDYTGVTIGTSNKGVETLSPGVYCGGLSVHSAEVVLLPGFYQIQDGPLELQGNASVTGSGVSILLSGSNAALDLQGSPKLNLTAMLTGPLAGIAISSNTAASPRLVSKLQGSPDVTLTGSIRLPNQTLKMQGSPALTLNGSSDKAIAHEFQLHGSPDLVVKANDANDRSGGFADLRLVR
jgi:hypothetical protein